MTVSVWEQARAAMTRRPPITARGVVTDLTGLIIEASGPAVGVGTNCTILQNGRAIGAQVVGFRKDRILLMPLGEHSGLAPGAEVFSRGESVTAIASEDLLGRVVDPSGRPLDKRIAINYGDEVPLFREPPSPLERDRISSPLDVGIKAVNSLLTVGKGQRIAIMAGSGVGKSTFLGMIAKHSRAQVNIIALVGERGREVREFIERDLGPEGMKRSVVVVSTSDTSSLLRVRAAFYATALAEYFRDKGYDVNLLLDSVTRFCMAQREIGLAVGEPPSSSGYTPSVFAMLPKLMERAGTRGGKGAITGFYTVLVEGDDMNEPIADAVRGILDGHIVLSRQLASRGHYPAIDILGSVSRVMSDIVVDKGTRLARLARRVLADYQEVEDLINIGAYKAGQNKRVDYAVQHIDALREFLMQYPEEAISAEDSWDILGSIFADAEGSEAGD